jgi:hypothetical protein
MPTPPGTLTPTSTSSSTMRWSTNPRGHRYPWESTPDTLHTYQKASSDRPRKRLFLKGSMPVPALIESLIS